MAETVATLSRLEGDLERSPAIPCAMGGTVQKLLVHNLAHDRMHLGQIHEKRWALDAMQEGDLPRLLAEMIQARAAIVAALLDLPDEALDRRSEAARDHDPRGDRARALLGAGTRWPRRGRSSWTRRQRDRPGPRSRAPGGWPRRSPSARRNTTAPRASRSRTWPSCARRDCWGCWCPRRPAARGKERPLFARVTAALAEGCGATALMFTMHSAAVAQIGRDARPEQRDRLLAAAVGGASTGSPSATPAADGGEAGVTAVPPKCGLALHGRKSFVTGAAVADAFVATVGEPGGEAFMAVCLKTGGRGSAWGEWDAMGMRASASHDLVFDGYLLDRTERLGPPCDETVGVAPSARRQAPGSTRAWRLEHGTWSRRAYPNGIFAIGFAATSVGIAAAALAHLRRELRARAERRSRAALPECRFGLADAETAVAAARALLGDRGRSAGAGRRGRRRPPSTPPSCSPTASPSRSPTRPCRRSAAAAYMRRIPWSASAATPAPAPSCATPSTNAAKRSPGPCCPRRDAPCPEGSLTAETRDATL